MPFLLSFGSFFLKYWKQFVLVGAIALVLFFVYNKGKKDCQLAAERKARTELEHRVDQVQKETDRTDRIQDKIALDRQQRPVDDDRDSCLLSNDPYKTKCIK